MTNPTSLVDKYRSYYLPPQLEKTFKCYKKVDHLINVLTRNPLKSALTLKSLERTLNGFEKEVKEIYSQGCLSNGTQGDLKMGALKKEIYIELFNGFQAQKARLDVLLLKHSSPQSKRVRNLMLQIVEPHVQSVDCLKKSEVKGWIAKARGLATSIKTACVAAYQFSKTYASEFATTIRRQPSAFATSLALFVAKSLSYSSLIMNLPLFEEVLLESTAAYTTLLSCGVVIPALFVLFLYRIQLSVDKVKKKDYENLTDKQLQFVLPLMKRVLRAEGKEDLVIKLERPMASFKWPMECHAGIDSAEINGSQYSPFAINVTREFGKKDEVILIHELGHIVNGDCGFEETALAIFSRMHISWLLNQSILPLYFLNILFSPKISDKVFLAEKILPLGFIYHYLHNNPSFDPDYLRIFPPLLIFASLLFHSKREQESRADGFALKYASSKGCESLIKLFKETHAENHSVDEQNKYFGLISTTVFSLLAGRIIAKGNTDVGSYLAVEVFKAIFDLCNSIRGINYHPSALSRVEKFSKNRHQKLLELGIQDV